MAADLAAKWVYHSAHSSPRKTHMHKRMRLLHEQHSAARSRGTAILAAYILLYIFCYIILNLIKC